MTKRKIIENELKLIIEHSKTLSNQLTLIAASLQLLTTKMKICADLIQEQIEKK